MLPAESRLSKDIDFAEDLDVEKQVSRSMSKSFLTFRLHNPWNFIIAASVNIPSFEFFRMLYLL